MATDTTVNNLIINVLSKEQYDGIAQKSATELYLVPDDTETVKSVSVNGSTYTPDSTGDIDLGTISGGSGGSGEANVIESVKVNGTALTVTNKAVDITAVPASIVTQDATHRFATDTEKSTWNGKQDALSNATVLSGISSTDITNWNSKTDNIGTVTGVKMNGTTNNPTSGVVDLGTVLTSESSLSKGTTSGSGNAVTDISVSGHTITLTKGSTFAADSNVVHILGDETITGDKTFSGQVQFDSGNPVYFLGDNMVRSDIFITNNGSGATNVQITTDNNNDNRVVVKASETGFSWIQASNGTLNLQSVLDSKLTSSDIPTLSKGTTTGSGNAVTDISVSGHTITLTKGSTFLTSHQDISGKADDSLVVHKAGNETITGVKTFSPNNVQGSIVISSDTYDAFIEHSGAQDFSWIKRSDSFDLQSELNLKENSSNKVTSISSSSTNTQYPSALAVYNYGQTLTSSLTTIYSGSGAPSSSLGNNGDIYIKVT